MKKKFAGLNFDSIQVLSQAELGKVRGGYGGTFFLCSVTGATYYDLAACNQNCKQTIATTSIVTWSWNEKTQKPQRNESPWGAAAGSLTGTCS